MGKHAAGSSDVGEAPNHSFGRAASGPSGRQKAMGAASGWLTDTVIAENSAVILTHAFRWYDQSPGAKRPRLADLLSRLSCMSRARLVL